MTIRAAGFVGRSRVARGPRVAVGRAGLLGALILLGFALPGPARSDAAGGETSHPESLCPPHPQGAPMTRTITTLVDIDAPAERVWEILLDFPRHAEWNPFVVEISGTATRGSRLDIAVRPPGGRVMRFSPEVLVADAPRELRWLGRLGLPRIFDGEHAFVLEPRGEDRVRLVHSECFRGLLVPMLWRGLDRDTRAGFVAMNAALKARAEAAAVADPPRVPTGTRAAAAH